MWVCVGGGGCVGGDRLKEENDLKNKQTFFKD